MDEEITRLRAKRDKLENTLDHDDGSMSETKEILLRQQLVAVENQIAALLASHGSAVVTAVAPPTLPPTLSAPPPPRIGQSGLVDLCPWRQLDCFGASTQGENTAALQHLATIIRNILQFPQQDRFQSLRMGNDRLQKELFHVRLGDAAMLMPQLPEEQRAESAAEAFLFGIGFRRELRPVAHTAASRSEDDRETEPWLVFTLSPPTSPSSESYLRLTAALQDIEAIRRRDTDTQRHSAEFQTIRRSVVMEIRMDRLRQAVESGEAEALCEMLMLGEGPGESRGGRVSSSSSVGTATVNELDEDELSETLDNIQTLRRVLQNIADAPHEERYRMLRIGNKLVRRTLMTQRGGLEFLLGVGGFTQREDGDVVLEGTALTAKEKTVNALRCLEKIERSVAAKCEAARERARIVAVESARAEVEAEVMKSRRAKRHQDSLAAMAERQQNGGGVRIRLEDAVKYLLGGEDALSAPKQ
jgi:hypothetical protein